MTPINFAVKILKFELGGSTPKDENGIANSEDPDQTAPVCSGISVRTLRE